MSQDESITHWIQNLKQGESAAASQLWERYFRRLVGLARLKLAALPRRSADEEDVALSAFKSLCLGAERGKFPELMNRENLWPLLVLLTARKACDFANYERRQKRGGGKVIGQADLSAQQGQSLDDVLGREPTPEFAAMVEEEYQQLLNRLNVEQRELALLKMEGYTNPEVAAKLGCSLRTVERRLELIRRIWEHPE